MVHVPTQAPGFTEEPTPVEGAEACARAAFELALDRSGQVRDGSLRLLVWEDDGRDPYALVRLQARARASRWEIPAGKGEPGTPPDSLGIHVHLRLDCGPTASSEPLAAWGAFESRLRESLRMRRLAREHLQRQSGNPWSEHALDCLWIDLASWRRGPFLHDAVEGWESLEPRLQAVQERQQGLWVCRAPRSSHMGQFVFLDREGQVLAVARYWLGE